MEVLTYPNPLLREETVPLRREKILSREFRHFCFDLLRLMEKSNGVGLAANQVGIDDRVFVMKNKDGLRRIVINPEWTATSSKQYEPMEGCLSFPEQVRQVKRYQDIRLIYTDITGAIRHELFSGLDAQIVQHETNHLDAILLVDHSGPSYSRKK